MSKKSKYYYYDGIVEGMLRIPTWSISKNMPDRYFKECVNELSYSAIRDIEVNNIEVTMLSIIWRVDRDINVRNPRKSKHLKRSAVLAICSKIGWDRIEDPWPVELR